MRAEPDDVRELFLYFIHERENVRLNKEHIGIEPFSDDKIFQIYSFCNVNREHDRVTTWIRENVRSVPMDHRTMVLNLAVARIFNEPKTLKHLLPFEKPDGLMMRISRFRKSFPEEKLFRGAYMMPSHGEGGRGLTASEYWCSNIVKLKEVGLPKCNTLRGLADLIIEANGFGNFLANQICTDMRYTEFYKKAETEDWTTFVLAGPGTQRGMARYFGVVPYGGAQPMRQTKDCHQIRLLTIRDDIRDFCSDEINEHFQDINNLSNCFCEFDKFCRAREIPEDDNRHRIGLRKYKHNDNNKQP